MPTTTDWEDHYRKIGPVRMKPWTPSVDMSKATVPERYGNDSPKNGDMLLRTHPDSGDMLLVSEVDYEEYYIPSPD